MKAKKDIIELAIQQCAIDFNCNAADFKKDKNIIVTPKNLDDRRYFISGEFFFRMVTFGGNAVISADEKIQPWLREYIKDKTGHELFEEPHQRVIDSKLIKYNKPLWSTTHSYLPNMDAISVKQISDVKWFEQDDILPLYEDDRFHNAIQYKIKPNRPDVLVVASYDNGEITGMAGASADSQMLWQIGIDVLLNHRSEGLGTYLVTLLKNEITKRGYIPYYSTSQSNIYSQNIARNTGFFPAWVEAYSTEPKQ